MVAVAGLIAAVVVPVSLTNGADKALTRSVGPTSPHEQTASESAEMTEESAPARPTPSSAADDPPAGPGEYQPTEADTAAVVDTARRYLEAINAGEVDLADSLTCGGTSLVGMVYEGTLTVSGDVEWTYSGDAAFVPYLVGGQPAEAPLVIRRTEQGFCPTL